MLTYHADIPMSCRMVTHCSGQTKNGLGQATGKSKLKIAMRFTP